MQEIFDFLRSNGFKENDIGKGFKNFKNNSDFVRFINDLAIKIDFVAEAKGTTSRFNFIASNSLSGGIDKCHAIDCRLKKIDNLIQFGALYADTIYINSPFAFLLESFKFEFNEHEINNILVGIKTLFKLESLLNAGVVKFIRSTGLVCKDCLKKISRQKIKRINEVESLLLGIYKERLQFKFFNDENHGRIEIIGPQDIIEHEEFSTYFKQYTPKSLQKYKGTNNITVKWSEVEEAGIINMLLVPVVDDFLLQDWYTKFYNVNYLTDRALDLEIIGKLNDDEIAKKNAAYGSLMQSLIYFTDIRPEDALKIRNQEQESFELYRISIEKFKRETLGIDPKKYKEAFDDLVQSNLIQLNKKLGAYKTQKLRSIRKKVVINSGLLTIGLFSGILPQNFSDILALAGGFQICESLLTELSNFQEVSTEIHSDPYYFLWKVNNV